MFGKVIKVGEKSMKSIQEILDKISSISNDNQEYVVFEDDTNKCYFGKDKTGHIAFLIESSSPNISPLCQETKSLSFVFNKRCKLVCNGECKRKVMHALTCKEQDRDKLETFLRLTKSFSSLDSGADQYYFAKLFSSLSALFDKQHKISEKELQGLFSELYVILYFNSVGCDIARQWQSRSRMKFDFSFDKRRRLEIKSTLKSERVHHFKHEQLRSELYDIKLASVMLRKNDFGISLFEVVEKIREIYADNFALMLHIDNTISQIDDDLMRGLKYDEIYLKENIRFYDAKDVPHFNEKTPEGVFNAEYDCQLDASPYLSIDEIKNWIING